MQAVAPVTLQWSGGHSEGSNVAVTGCFWGWSSPAILNGPGHAIDLKLVPGTYEFKFLVDGQWLTSDSYPTVRTYLGDDIRNNIITVEPNRATEETEVMKSATLVTSATEPPNTEECYQAVYTSRVESAPPQSAFDSYGQDTKAETIACLERELQEMKLRNKDLQDNLIVAQQATSTAAPPTTGAADTEYVQQQDKNIAFLTKKLQDSQEEIGNLRSHLNLAAEEKKRVAELTFRVEHLVANNEKLDRKLSDFKDMYARTAFGLTAAEVSKYRAAFDLFDKNKDGHITKEELVAAIKDCGLKPNAKWIQDLIREADEDESGTIEWPEFLHAMTRHVAAQKSPSSVQNGTGSPTKTHPPSQSRFSSRK